MGLLHVAAHAARAVDDFDFDALFRANDEHEYRCEPVGQWDCILAGRIIGQASPPSWDCDTSPIAIVDCGGIYFPLRGLTHDVRVVGEWVQFKAIRIEVQDVRPLSVSVSGRSARRGSRR
jgi:hypothetical protein